MPLENSKSKAELELTYLNAGDALIEHGLPDDEELTLIVNWNGADVRRMSSAEDLDAMRLAGWLDKRPK